MNSEDLEMLRHHFRAWFGRYVPDEEQNGFEVFAVSKIEEDPDYWNNEGWRKLYDLYLSQKYPGKKEGVVNVDKLIERVLNGESPTRLVEEDL